MTHLCINCNSSRVERSGDDFTCRQCGYTWDVAHEQANAAYLAAQGRAPAQSVAERQASSGLDAALGLDQSTADSQPPEPSAQDQLIAALLKRTVTEIGDLADEADIDLGEARLKDEKVAALVVSGKLALDEHGDVFIQRRHDDED